MATVLVLGAGFIGSHIAEEMVRHGHAVRVLSRTRREPLTGDPAVDREIEYFQGDLADAAQVARASTDADGIYYCVRTTHPGSSNVDPLYDLQTNLLAAVSLIDQLKSGYRGKLVFLSSITVYGLPGASAHSELDQTDPLCSYGITKLAVEKYLHMYHHLFGLDYVTLRCSNTYGERQDPASGQGVVNVFLDRALRDQPIEIWGDGTIVRDYIYVRDLAAAARLALEASGPSRTFNLGSGTGTSLNELVRLVSEVASREVRVVYREARAIDASVTVPDISAITRELGWVPRTDLVSGLEKTLGWMRDEGSASLERRAAAHPPAAQPGPPGPSIGGFGA